MLTRQRIILSMMDQAGGTLEHTPLVKLLFLLRQETSVGCDTSFYHFVPYKYGPFSFSLYRELSSLERDGLVQRSPDGVQLVPRTVGLIRREVGELPSGMRIAIGTVVARYANLKHDDLLRDVYTRYPWFASKSELRHLVPPHVPAKPKSTLAVFTVGYEGKSVDEFFDGLLRAGIESILDVRANPVSRKYGFAKSSLSDIAGKLGLCYQHLPELGISSSDRVDLDDFDSYQRLLYNYEHAALPKRQVEIGHVAQLLRRRPSALLCMEKDVRCCHRGRLAQAVAKKTGLKIIHL